LPASIIGFAIKKLPTPDKRLVALFSEEIREVFFPKNSSIKDYFNGDA